MNPADLRYAQTHEWVHVGDDNIATVGLSAHAIEALTDLVYMDLPAVGTAVASGNSFGEVESVKATSDLYSPVDGEIVDVNKTLPDNLDVLSTDPYGEGWIIKVNITDNGSLDNLMDHAAYEKMCSEEG